jgi:hypothetical protein
MVAVFGSVVDPARLRFPFDRIAASDARDSDAIRQWASEVADTCCASPRAAPIAQRQTR